MQSKPKPKPLQKWVVKKHRSHVNGERYARSKDFKKHLDDEVASIIKKLGIKAVLPNGD